MSEHRSLFARALLAVLLLPGTVAFLVPLLLLAPAATDFHVLALVPVILGLGILFWAVSEFYLAGRGTLAPWSPPTRLMVRGPYRYSRNPMYVAVLAILAGWALGFGSWPLSGYAVLVAGAFQWRVVSYEEPVLKAAHTRQWADYAANVPRWLF